MQRIRSVYIGGFVGISAAMMLLAAGCQDIVEIPKYEPTASSSSSSSSSASSSGTGGMGSSSSSSSSSSSGSSGACISNTDCVTPTPICDVPKGKCVECLEATDCSLKPGTVCSAGVCACPTPGDSYCREPNRCVDWQTDSSDCGMCDHPCFGSCTAGKCADAWQPTPWKDAPSARANHVAVWTGSKMIVWGGETASGNTNTGGMLDVASYRWEPTSTANAPTPRRNARAVWNGTVMVMWGGENGTPLNTGGIFNPATNTWKAMAQQGAPSARYGHSIVWTGSKVIIWGGTNGPDRFGDGAAYDINAEAWESIPGNGLPPSPRENHSAVWTGTLMVVFGGFGFNGVDFGYLGDGAEFDPATGSWASVKNGAPSPRAQHGSAWTGTEMIIWGGRDANGLSATGARYKPTIEWAVMTSDASPELRQYHTQEWITPRLIIWGGQNAGGAPLDTGALYDPVTNAWSNKPIPSGPAARTQHSSVNASGKLIVFGGVGTSGFLNSGGILDPMML